MKACLHCHNIASDDAATTCANCGEGSWGPLCEEADRAAIKADFAGLQAELAAANERNECLEAEVAKLQAELAAANEDAAAFRTMREAGTQVVPEQLHAADQAEPATDNTAAPAEQSDATGPETKTKRNRR